VNEGAEGASLQSTSVTTVTSTVEGDVKRRRQLIVLGAGGLGLIVLALLASLFPVVVSVPGESTYNCGSSLRRWRGDDKQTLTWAADTITVMQAYPESKKSQRIPMVMCENKAQWRISVLKTVMVIGGLMIVAPIILFWYLFGFIRDPHA
jgi:hypothetical protein